MKLRFYIASNCPNFTNASEEWTLSDTVLRKINGYNRDVFTKLQAKATEKLPQNQLGHLLRMPRTLSKKNSLMTYINTGQNIPVGSIASSGFLM